MEASSTRMDGGYPPEAMTEALLKWMGTFSSSSSSSSSSKALLRLLGSSDGVEMAKVLGRIDPEYFGATERIKLKEDVPADNKRLKANNLKKVLAAIDEYNADVLGIGYDYDQRYFAAPDPAKAAEGDPYHIGKEYRATTSRPFFSREASPIVHPKMLDWICSALQSFSSSIIFLLDCSSLM